MWGAGDQGRVNKINHEDDYKSRMDQVKKISSEKYFNKFKDLIARYESEFEIWF
jgi:REP element-mobilizing transposase RayT